jgi:hypothetical protein
MHAVKTLTLLEPEFATNKLFPSADVQALVAAVNPAHRENAMPVGLVPAV